MYCTVIIVFTVTVITITTLQHTAIYPSTSTQQFILSCKTCSSSLDSKQQFAADCISLICFFAQCCYTALVVTSTVSKQQITSTNCLYTTNHQYQLSAHKSPVPTVRTNRSPVPTVRSQITSTNCPHTNHQYQLSAHNKSPVPTVRTQITSTNCPHTTNHQYQLPHTNHQYQLSAHKSPVPTVRTQITSTNSPHTNHQYQLSAHKSPVPTVRTQITSTNCPHTTRVCLLLSLLSASHHNLRHFYV